MAVVVRRKDREAVDFGRAEITVTYDDIGSTIDFAGIVGGFTIVDANVTVEKAFANADNTISVGLTGSLEKFVTKAAANAVKGLGFTNIQYKADKPTSIYVDVKGSASTTGKAVVSIVYSKNASSRTDY